MRTGVQVQSTKNRRPGDYVDLRYQPTLVEALLVNLFVLLGRIVRSCLRRPVRVLLVVVASGVFARYGADVIVKAVLVAGGVLVLWRLVHARSYAWAVGRRW
jgi:hypothetical protein